MNDRRPGADPDQPDPTSDAWSAWLPRLDPLTTPLPQAGAPLPQAGAPLPQAGAPLAQAGAPLPEAGAPPADPHPAAGGPPESRTAPPSWYAAPRHAPAPSPPLTYTAPPPSRLALAVLCTVFCFAPFGIVAIVKACSVNTKWAQGRWAEAQAASRSARTWCILAALMWLAPAVLFAFLAGLAWGDFSFGM
jgi:hypothetical protein